MRDVGSWVLKESLVQAEKWRRAGVQFGSISVNLSVQELASPTLLETVNCALQNHSFAAEILTLELSEHVPETGLAQCADTLKDLRSLGIRIAFDDFGIDESSFGCLHHIEADALKIDRSFVRGIATRPVDAAIAWSLVSLGQHMSIPVVAEGVETPEQYELLCAHGIDSIQGFLLCPPLPAREYTSWVAYHEAQTQLQSVVPYFLRTGNSGPGFL